MLIVASDAHRAHHPREPFFDAGRLMDPPEVPERVDRILDAIAGSALGVPQPPRSFGAAPITRVHTPEYLEFLEHAHARWRATTGPGGVVGGGRVRAGRYAISRTSGRSTS